MSMLDEHLSESGLSISSTILSLQSSAIWIPSHDFWCLWWWWWWWCVCVCVCVYVCVQISNLEQHKYECDKQLQRGKIVSLHYKD